MRSDDERVEVDAMRSAHRAASAQVDDRPDASVRAAVLAAAARAVHARPQPASTATRPAPSRSRRWPWSAAALLVVSVTTGLVATRVMRDRPEHLATVASSVPPIARTDGTAAPSVAPAPPAKAVASADLAKPRRPAPVVEPTRLRMIDQPSRMRDLTERPMADARPPSESPPEPTAAPAPSIAAPSAKGRAAMAPPEDVNAEDTTSARRAQTQASQGITAQDTARMRIGRASEPTSPEAWVRRIVKLRADGDDVEADRELDGLRRRYPDYEIPATASRAAGTR